MKTFNQFLLEYDPNRGAPWRATPLAGHFPDIIHMGAASERAKNSGIGFPTKGDKDKRIASLTNAMDRGRLYSRGGAVAGVKTPPEAPEFINAFMSGLPTDTRINSQTLPHMSDLEAKLARLTPFAHQEKIAKDQKDEMTMDRYPYWFRSRKK